MNSCKHTCDKASPSAVTEWHLNKVLLSGVTVQSCINTKGIVAEEEPFAPVTFY